MPGCVAEETLVELMERRLSPQQEADLHQHIDGCPSCRQLLAMVAGVLAPTAGPESAPPAPADGAGLLIGQRLGPYQVVRRLGQGGMGAVYEAIHEKIERRAAIKVLHLGRSSDPRIAQRFLNEARAANLISHPNIVDVYEIGQLDSGEAYIIMERLEGESLRERMQRGPVPTLAVLRFGQQIASALAAAHDKNIVHRDLKPDNVMIVADPMVPGGERVKILDFGIAKLAVAPGTRAGASPGTESGMLMGTPRYMAPEQFRSAARVDGKADVYSLGVMLYELLAGRPPFSATTPAELIAMHLRDPPRPLEEQAPEASGAVAELVHAMLAKDPGARPAMREVAERLERQVPSADRPKAAGPPGEQPAGVPRWRGDSLIGSVLGERYRVERRLKRGGMGEVYLGRHLLLDKAVAIKVMLRAGDDHGQERFRREARLCCQVRHPHVLQVLDYGWIAQGDPYLVMELLEGPTLGAAMKRGPMPAERACAIAGQIATGLQAIHRQGIVHRDLKPDNVILLEQEGLRDFVKIADFGLAISAAGPRLTESEHMVGTPAYIAPEQVRGGRVDARADLYALGCILYEMLTGQVPFTSDSRQGLLYGHLHEPPVPPARRRPDLAIPAALDALVLRMLAKEPGARPGMQEVADQLEHLFDPPLGSPPRSLLVSRAGRAAASLVAPRVLRAAPLLGAGLAAGAVALALWWGHATRDRPGRGTPEGMVLVPGGTFTMGSSLAEIEAAAVYCQAEMKECPRALFEREQPQHAVTVSPFYLDRLEVSIEQFAAWLNQVPGLALREEPTPGGKPGAIDRWVLSGGVRLANLFPQYQPAYGLIYEGGRYQAVPGFGHRPMTQVTWDGALRYCQACGKRLPTEAEWELAARGVQGRRFPWGHQDPACQGVVFARADGLPCHLLGASPADVGTAPQDITPEGVRDLGGNVAEWVLDRFADRYVACPPPCRDPRGPEGPPGGAPELRALRGGGWSTPAALGRGAGRGRRGHDEAFTDVGFRCASARTW